MTSAGKLAFAKEKRHVVLSLKDGLRHKLISVVAAVTVSSDPVHADKVLQGVEEAAGLLAAIW